ncbi:hypothetical protein BJ170DRAFT_367067 [Xylariales sp. AK1849]|nr:hypothetical protein BJ170DRAFT_367067 [Xylariales sp. AK1849]
MGLSRRPLSVHLTLAIVNRTTADRHPTICRADRNWISLRVELLDLPRQAKKYAIEVLQGRARRDKRQASNVIRELTERPEVDLGISRVKLYTSIHFESTSTR